MNLLKKAIFISLTIFSISCFARASVPIIDQSNIEISSKPITFEKFKKAIKVAGQKNNWQINESSEKNTLVGTLDVRGKHTISVTITFSSQTYSVAYRDSHNMNYKTNEMGQSLIHPKYNDWVKSLISNINLELGKS